LIYLAGDLGYQWGDGLFSIEKVGVFDVLYLIGYVVMISAAQLAWQHHDAVPAENRSRSGPRPRNVVPWVVAAGLYAVLIDAAVNGNLDAVSTLTIAALLVTVAILIRGRSPNANAFVWRTRSDSNAASCGCEP
jgi:hypothetical protein